MIKPDLAGLRILVVEDEYFVACDAKDILCAGGAEAVTLSGDVSDARRRLDDTKIDAALVDINLQGVQCFQVADQLRRLDIPFAFVTGYDPSIIPARFRLAPYCEKPVNDRQLIAAVASLARTRSALPADAICGSAPGTSPDRL